MIVEPDLDHLCATWGPALTGLLAARGSSWSEAEELAQDVLAEAWLERRRFRGAFDDERAVGAWLAGIARNLQRVALRRARRRPRPLEEPDAVAGPAGDESEARARAVREAVERLPASEREVVQAFYLDETSTTRIAALLGLTARAVEGRLRRARARLAAWLDAARPARS